jgi:hypothetical protein
MNQQPADHENIPRDPSEIADAEKDGRNIEWEDRARVNIEPPSKKSTNIERDFEPENVEEEKKDPETAY